MQTAVERPGRKITGFLVLLLEFGILAGIIATIISMAQVAPGQTPTVPSIVLLVGLGLSFFLLMPGFFTVEPNSSKTLVFFGAYVGTVRDSGFWWTNPFCARKRVSLRVRNFNSEQLKVNDQGGNPIEIAAVVIWRVQDTAQAMFDVDDYEHYVETQSESALRHIASHYAYDQGEEDEITLRSHVDEVSQALRGELHERLAKAGVRVEEARLTHLAYAPEIAQAMLRRQQAEAVIAARQKIVHGAVSMVEMALKELAEKQVVSLDDERRAAMVSNLMVVLCSESEVHPIVNTGTLYT